MTERFSVQAGDRLRVYLDESNCIMIEHAYHHPPRVDRFTVSNADALIDGLRAAQAAQASACDASTLAIAVCDRLASDAI